MENEDKQNLINKIVELEKVKVELEHERKLTQESAKLASLGEMAAGIGHEIKNPLSVILGETLNMKLMCDIEETIDIDYVIEKCDSIEETVTRINNIVESMKVIGRNGTNDERRIITVAELMDTLVMSTFKFEDNFINFKTEVQQGSLKRLVKLNHSEVAQVFVNLFNNACDELQKNDDENRKVTLNISETNGYLEFSVHDNGAGVPDEAIEDLFTPFFTTKEVGKGTGLGLSISKKIAMNHGGDLYLKDSEVGANFVIRLPIFDEAA